mgnify:FL=1
MQNLNSLSHQHAEFRKEIGFSEARRQKSMNIHGQLNFGIKNQAQRVVIAVEVLLMKGMSSQQLIVKRRFQEHGDYSKFVSVIGTQEQILTVSRKQTRRCAMIPM